MKHNAIAALLLVSCAGSLCAQTTMHVATTGNDTTGDGSSGNPYLTISNGVFNTPAGGTVLVSTGHYELSAAVRIAKALTVRSWNAAAGGVEDRENTIMDGNMACAPLYFDHASVLVAGFTVTRGNSIRGFQDNFGGGVIMNSGVLSNCIVAGNVASHWGGGIYMNVNANASVVDCIVRDNNTTNTTSWGRGGGIYMRDGAGVILNSQIISNKAFASGGGIHALASAVISNCFIASNQLWSVGGAVGGGVHVAGTNVLLAGCVISNNISALVGGGVCVELGGYATVLDTTIVDNQARMRGGGFQLYNATVGGGALVSNCVIAGNRLYELNAAGAGVADGYINRAGSGTLAVVNTRIVGNGLDANTRFGGGVWIYTHGTSAFYNCEILSNRIMAVSADSHSGAGMYIGTGSVRVAVQNCLIAGNKIEGVSGSGGGIFFGTATCTTSGPSPLAVTIQSCTITDNAVTRDYGGMHVTNTTGITVWNTIVASNRADRFYPDSGGAEGYSSLFRYSCAPELINAAQGNITNAPIFAGYDTGNYRLAGGSPGINVGTNQVWMALPGAVDLDGRPRVDRLIRQTDMGCYEYISGGTVFWLR